MGSRRQVEVGNFVDHSFGLGPCSVIDPLFLEEFCGHPESEQAMTCYDSCDSLMVGNNTVYFFSEER